MKTFEFEIKEILSKLIEVDANSEDEAYQKVKNMYKSKDIVLDNSDVTDFSVKKVLINDDALQKDNLAELVDYLYQDEKKHYEAFNDNKPSNHIFLKLEKIKKLI